jgi:predicted amidohydrolase YtcJ
MRTGLREAHAHIAQHGRAMDMLRLGSCRSRDECLEGLAAAARAARPWILGDGVRVESWPDPRWPSAAQLDAAAGDTPVCLWSFDYHELIVNSAAMRAVGVGDGTPDPPHGRIMRDEQGRPTGLMVEAAAKLVWSRVPEPSAEQRREQVRAAAADLASHGFEEVHDLLAPPWLGVMLGEMDRRGELPVRVLLYPRLEDLDAVKAGAAAWESDRVRLAGAKLFADGTLNSRTASMLEPYADPLPGLPRGDAMLSREQLREAMNRVASVGLGLAVHAIGDAAVRAVLDAWESLDAKRRAASRAPVAPLRIEHAEIIDAADVPRFARLGVACSVQPCHLLADVEALRRGLPHRLHRVLPLRELIDSGCRPGELLLFGSDTPIVRPHPEDSLRAAVHRRREGAAAADAIAPEQAITDPEAWRAFAAGAGRR